MLQALELVNLWCAVCDLIIVTLVFNKDVFADLKPCGAIQAACSNPDPVFVIHLVEQARTAIFAEAAFRKIRGYVPSQPVISCEMQIFICCMGGGPNVPAGSPALAAMTHSHRFPNFGDFKADFPAIAPPCYQIRSPNSA